MTPVVAVIAHSQKTFGGGLPGLRRLLVEHGCTDPIWYEVSKSREAHACALKALDEGAELLFIWGGDGTVQRCIDAVTSKPVRLAILPAGTANLLASNLQLPMTLPEAVAVGFSGTTRVLDVGVINDERFGVMAGVGLDAAMMHDADGRLKERFGRLAYVFTGMRASRMHPLTFKVKVDGKQWFKGRATSVLLGQMGSLGGGVVAFPDAQPDDGLLEVGVINAVGPLQLARVIGRSVIGRTDRSRFVEMTRGRRVRITVDRKTRFQLDGGTRKPTRKLRASIEPSAITVCVPHGEQV